MCIFCKLKEKCPFLNFVKINVINIFKNMENLVSVKSFNGFLLKFFNDTKIKRTYN